MDIFDSLFFEILTCHEIVKYDTSFLLKVKHNFFHKYYNSIYRFKSVFFVMHLNTILLCIH